MYVYEYIAHKFTPIFFNFFLFITYFYYFHFVWLSTLLNCNSAISKVLLLWIKLISRQHIPFRFHYSKINYLSVSDISYFRSFCSIFTIRFMLIRCWQKHYRTKRKLSSCCHKKIWDKAKLCGLNIKHTLRMKQNARCKALSLHMINGAAKISRMEKKYIITRQSICPVQMETNN